MTDFFINFTNHPSAVWDDSQINAARCFGDILDIPFPTVSPTASAEEICRLGEEYVQLILSKVPRAVLCQGEFTLSYYVIRRLLEHGIKVFAACTERQVIMVGNEKRSIFSFVQFREYL